MFLLGDVLAIVSLIGGISLSVWGLMVGLSVLFPRKIQAGKAELDGSAWKCLGIGFAIGLPLGILSVILLSLPLPLLKLMGWGLMLALLTLSTLGVASLARLIGERIQAMDPSVGSLPALVRGSLYIVLASLLPIFGWFVLTPIFIMVGVGAGVFALTSRQVAPQWTDQTTLQ